jgi:hypothetical protein
MLGWPTTTLRLWGWGRWFSWLTWGLQKWQCRKHVNGLHSRHSDASGPGELQHHEPLEACCPNGDIL